MQINEIVKTFLKQPNELKDKESSTVSKTNTLIDLTNSDLYPNTGSFFDDNNSSLFGRSEISDVVFKQKDKIMRYRQLAMTPDISDAVDEIVNEITFSTGDKIPLKIDINEDNTKLVEAITEKFEKINKLLNIKRQLFSIVKRGYVDGQIIMHCAYEKSNTKSGITSIKMIEPCMLYFDIKDNSYKYMNSDKNIIGFNSVQQNSYNIEELVREDFGLYDGNVNLGYLEYAIKPANILKTLEDLLIPMRFSRSISRRVFNVDIGDLPSKRGAEVMNEYQNKFKYKKFYNNETGEVSNQQHITSMVEDYWFSNRSGSKGTTVETIDESGNLGELGDILYFAKKLYRALKIPSSRIDINPDGDKDFDYESTRVSKEDMKFFIFISRLRQVFSSLFKEILKREVISCGIMSESEWNEKEDFISIEFINENKFIEKMKLENLLKQMEIYGAAKEFEGKIFPVRNLLKDIFNYSDEEINDNFKDIDKEAKDKTFAKFYIKEEF